MATPDRANTLGVVLAGGRSSRMGGGDKGLRDLGGRPMLAHVLDRFRPQVAHVVINANGDAVRFDAFALTVVPDVTDQQRGPLEGLLAALLWTRANAPEIEYVATVAADTPFLPNDLVNRLARGFSGDHAAAISASGDRTHPTAGLWSAKLQPQLAAALDAGERKVIDWTMRIGAAIVTVPPTDFAGRTVDPFFNANTPDEFTEASRLVELAKGKT